MSSENRGLEQYEDRWRTSMGGFFVGERVVLRGQDLLTGMRGMGWMEQHLYAVTGRVFTEQQIKLFESIWSMAVSYPDPRIWPNRVGALACSARSTGGLGLSAALAVSEAELWGHRANIQAIDFLHHAMHRVERGEALEEVVFSALKRSRKKSGGGGQGTRGLQGYGRAVGTSDERIIPMREYAESIGLGDGPFLRMAFQIHDILSASRYRLFMNSGGLCAALAADQGLSAREYYWYLLPSFSAGIVSCAMDAADHPEGSFFPLRCERIRYEGPPPRKWGDDSESPSV